MRFRLRGSGIAVGLPDARQRRGKGARGTESPNRAVRTFPDADRGPDEYTGLVRAEKERSRVKPRAYDGGRK